MGDERLWHTVMRSEEPYELRVVSVCEGDGGAFTLEERSDGEQTLLAYDALTCVRRMDVQGQHAEAACWALGPTDAGQTTVAVLDRFFSSEDVFLSDVMDVLDAGGVPYTYSVTCGNDLQLRVCRAPKVNPASIISSK